MTALLYQVEELALDVGRLRRRTDDEYSAHLLDRVACRVQNLDAIVCLSAGQLVAAGETVDRALALVDVRARQVRTLLGEESR